MKYLFANWKMYMGLEESRQLAQKVATITIPKNITAAIFPSALAFSAVRDVLVETAWGIGAQNVAWVPKGAYTGAVSAELFHEAGARYTLVGHSERRHIFGESDTAVRHKLEAALAADLCPILCIGETVEDRKEDKRKYRLQQQLLAACEQLSLIERIIIAYEPVWAIGTGEACLPADADDVIGWIKIELKKYTDAELPVLYGGSVGSEQVESYIKCESIDGVLIGSASTHFDSLSKLVAGAASVL